jgi:pyruvate/2-oxoacid:ferredoxin oxidoreductase beta subunit
MDGGAAMNLNFVHKESDLLKPGHFGCPGCGAVLAMKYTLDVLGKNTIVVMPAGCWSTLIGIFPYSCLSVPVMSVAFETTAATAAGIRAGLESQGKGETTVLAWAGDGGTFDIGLQALSGVAERNDDILYICYDNEAYMNTGIQRSSATPSGCWTTTSPASALKPQKKKNIMGIMAAHGVPYAASASISDPQDLKAKVKKAMNVKGTRFIHLLASCPTGWRHAPELTVEVARQAVKSRIFPLYEIENGEKWHLNPMPEKESIAPYLEAQARFKGMTPDMIAAFQGNVDADWDKLVNKCQGV